MKYIETEVKFHISDLEKLAARLEALGAAQISPRTYEVNLRFDTPAETLAAQACVLRLRQDAHSKLTFKGPTLSQDGVAQREEIEFSVSDFDAAQRFLERLGYSVVAIYEKYRTSYEFDGLYFMLDEMPYGDFFEIEGESAAKIRAMAEKLSLNFDAAVKMSYLEVFKLFQATSGFNVTDLTFVAFSDQKWNLAQINIFAAD